MRLWQISNLMSPGCYRSLGTSGGNHGRRVGCRGRFASLVLHDPSLPITRKSGEVVPVAPFGEGGSGQGCAPGVGLPTTAATMRWVSNLACAGQSRTGFLTPFMRDNGGSLALAHCRIKRSDDVLLQKENLVARSKTETGVTFYSSNRAPTEREDFPNFPKPSPPPVVPRMARGAVGQRALLIESRPQKEPQQFA